MSCFLVVVVVVGQGGNGLAVVLLLRRVAVQVALRVAGQNFGFRRLRLVRLKR
jgi:hypothetical protein